jgi:hypothetical protein
LQHFAVDVRRFDRETRPVELAQLVSQEPQGDATDIGSALAGAVQELAEVKGAAGVLLVSDGRATTDGALDAARLALARGVPIWTWCVGGPVPRRDLWIETPAAEALSFANTEVELAAMFHEAGYPNRSFNVELRSDDAVIETREVIPGADGTARVAFLVQAPAAGEHRYVFRVPPEPDEADTGNNESAVFLHVVGEKARVLLAEGQPHWDTKFLVQALKHDPRVELTAVYQLSPTRHVALVSARGQEQRTEEDLFPRTAAALNHFDVIILGRNAESFFDDHTEALLTDFVARRGGSLVFARGKAYGGRFPALSKLEPVVWGEGAETTVRLTPVAEHTVFDLGEIQLDALPALDQAMVTLGEKPLATVLAANGPNAILLAHQRYGQGRVVTLNAAGLWRWAFGDVEQARGETAYGTFWLGLLRWLLAGDEFLPGADVALTSERREYTSDQTLQFLIRTREADAAGATNAWTNYQPHLTITGARQTIELPPHPRHGGGWFAEAGPLAPGSYRVALTNNVGQPAEIGLNVDVVSASVEKRELSADPDLMRRLAEISGGQVLNASQAARFDDVYQRWRATRQMAQQETTVWDHWWLLGIIIGLFGAEWWVRRREGLL